MKHILLLFAFAVMAVGVQVSAQEITAQDLLLQGDGGQKMALQQEEAPEVYDAAADTLALPERLDGSVSEIKWQGGRAAWRREFSYTGLPLMAVGLAIWAKQDEYRTIRNDFVPHFNSRVDNYMQYSPLATTAILKACGVPTRSNWGRLVVGSAFSAVLMAATVNSIKYTVKEKRPDNTSSNSFPSGHTATAFMCATIMSKELGWKSPWYSVGAYTVASATGLFRVLNNRHWINDVVFGAGVGITAVDLGYYITDLIFKEKGINPESLVTQAPDLSAPPSFLSIGMSVGTGTTLRTPTIYDDYVGTGDAAQPAAGAMPMGLRLKMGVTTTLSAEGAWFFNKSWGICARVAATACPIKAEYNERFAPYVLYTTSGPLSLYQLDGIEAASMGVVTIQAGVYWSHLLAKRWRIGAKVLAGNRITTNFALNAYTSIAPDKRQVLDDMLQSGVINQGLYDAMSTGMADREFLRIDTEQALNLTTGVSMTYALRKNNALRFYVDYSYARPQYTYRLHNRARLSTDGEQVQTLEDVFTCATPLHHVNFGLSMAVMF